MKTYRVGLIGNGRMGKIYAEEIKKIKEFTLIKTLRNQSISKNPKAIKNFFNLKNIDLFIIASPINSHYKYLLLAHKANKHVIVEKPFVENTRQLKKIIELYNNYKKSLIIHHNDILNFDKTNFIKNINKIEKVEMIYGKRDINYTYKKPFLDWLPHPISLLIYYFGRPKKIKIKYYDKKIIKEKVIEKIEIQIEIKKIKFQIIFSNNLKLPSKKVIIYQKGLKKIYNGYHQKNQKTVKLLLQKFIDHKNKINHLNHIKNTYEIIFKIEKIIKLKIIK